MHYVAVVNGEERTVEIVETAPEHYRIILDGRTLDVDARAITDTTLSLLVDDKAFNIESERAPDGSQNLAVRGHVIGVDVLDLRRVSLRRAQSQSETMTGPATITSPMPGRVVAVLVKEGEAVREGQGLVVVEAMKMENELKAPRAGVVQQLRAREGSTVDGGTLLCVVE